MATQKKAPAKRAAKKAPAKKTGATTKPEATEGAVPEGLKVNVSGKKMANAALASVDVSAIAIVDGFNPRMRLGDIDSLRDSITKDGLVNPLTVRPGEGDKLELIAGERRLTAVKELGWATVPVVIRTDLGDDIKAKAVAVAENSPDGRSNLTPVELGKAFLEFKNEGWTPGRIAKETGVNHQRVRRCLTLVDAPEDVQAAVDEGKVGLMAANEFAKLDDDTREALRGRLHEGMTATQVREEAKRHAKENPEAAAATDGKRANRAKGAERAQQIKTWRGRRIIEATLAELCHIVNEATADERETSDFFEVRGACGAILWSRGDLESPLLPAADTTDKEEKKALKHFDSLVKAEAKRYTPPKDEGEEEGEGEE